MNAATFENVPMFDTPAPVEVAGAPERTSDPGQELSLFEAKRLTKEIRDSLALTHGLIERAWSLRAWVALGYTSWDEYVSHEFRDLVLTPPLEKRESTVASMHEAGMSLRAIATATDLGKSTVARTLASAREHGQVSEVERSTGVDGKSYDARKPVAQPAGVQLDDELLDLSADEIGVGFFDKHTPEGARAADQMDPRPKRPESPLVQLGRLPSQDEGASPSASTATAANESGVSAADLAGAVQVVNEQVKAAISQAGHVWPKDQVTQELIESLSSSLLVCAGMLKLFELSSADEQVPAQLRDHLQVAVATVDEVIDGLGGESR